MRYKILLILSLISFSAVCQHDNSPLGGRSAGLAHSSVCLSDLWSAQNNQSGLAEIKNIQAGFYYENRFLLKELSLKSMAVAIPSKTGVFGIIANHFGYELYNETKFGLSFAKRLFNNFDAAIQIDYLNTHISENYGNKGILTFEAGIRTKLSRQIIIAAHLFNPVKAKLTEYNNERIPSILKFGALYYPASKVIVSAEIEKNINYKADFRAGLEYNISKSIFLRTGISTYPQCFSLGLGFEYRKVKLDFASSVHQILGYSPQFSMIYDFR